MLDRDDRREDDGDCCEEGSWVEGRDEEDVEGSGVVASFHSLNVISRA